jgi:hypothetical protein
MRLAIVGAFLGLSACWWFIPFETRAAANEDLLIKDVTTPGVTDRQPEWRVFKPSDFIPFETRAANTDILVEDVIIPGVTDHIPEGGGGTLKLSDGGFLGFRYSPISDSGVHLSRLDRQGKIIWEQYCDRLLSGTVLHSEYYQEVFVYLEGETIRVVSQAGNAKFVERLALNSGKRLSRSVNCGPYGDVPHCIPSYSVPTK